MVFAVIVVSGCSVASTPVQNDQYALFGFTTSSSGTGKSSQVFETGMLIDFSQECPAEHLNGTLHNTRRSGANKLCVYK
jgi:hypothetical protein